jgi:enterochelin esterase family protein
VPYLPIEEILMPASRYLPRALIAAPAVALVIASGAVLADEPAKTPALTATTLAKRLAEKPEGAAAAQLADEITRWFGGKDNLVKGPAPKVEQTTVTWAIDAPGASEPPKVVSEDGTYTLALARIGDSDVYAAVVTLPDGAAMRWDFSVDGKKLPHPVRDPRQRAAASQLEVYREHPDSKEKPGIPKGKVTPMPKFESKIFDGTTRDWWVYVPAQAANGAPAAVMVFQDGGGYKEFVPPVFDNLIAERAMPVTVGVFVNPGTFAGGRSNRGFEYDTLSDQYVRFLLEEILPEVEKTTHLTLRHDAAGRAIAGASSGGICAWTAAWERPGEFSKVLSWVGSFTNLASGSSGRDGGHNYEAMIRRAPRKPIRALLQDGANDLDNPAGNWPLANQQMAKALGFKGYDYKFVYGNGFHSNRHGRAILPDSLRWLWRGWEADAPR